MMLKELQGFVRDVFRSWWGVVGILNGIVGYSSRVIDLGPASPFVGPLFKWLGIISFICAMFQAYRLQRHETEGLRAELESKHHTASVYIDKLCREVAHNLEHLNQDPGTLRDEAWRTIGVEALALLPRSVLDSAEGFYLKLRSLRDSSGSGDHRSSAMQRKRDLRFKLGLDGQRLLAQLKTPK